MDRRGPSEPLEASLRRRRQPLRQSTSHILPTTSATATATATAAAAAATAMLLLLLLLLLPVLLLRREQRRQQRRLRVRLQRRRRRRRRLHLLDKLAASAESSLSSGRRQLRQTGGALFRSEGLSPTSEVCRS